MGPGGVAQLVRELSLIFRQQGTCKKQPMNAWISGTTNRYLSLSLRSLSKKILNESRAIKVERRAG